MMVGRKNTSSSGSKRSPVAAEPALASRPKRNISPKSLDIAAGLSWREERELKKALYASLQESKRPSTPKPGEEISDEKEQSNTNFVPIRNKSSKPCRHSTRSSRSSSAPSTPASMPLMNPALRNVIQDETSQDSTISSTNSTSTLDSKKTKVRAQRKFAMNQTYNLNNDSCCALNTQATKQPTKSSSMLVFPKRAKTEDFLTFLCLRGTSMLPPHLDFFNFNRYDGLANNNRSTRDSSPSSSSTSISNNQEEVGEPRSLTPVNKFTTPSKKAARASASTPETCRGFAGVRPRMTKTSAKAQSPLVRRGRPPRSPSITPVKSSTHISSPVSKGRSPNVHKRDLATAKRKAISTLTQKGSLLKYRKKGLFPEDKVNIVKKNLKSRMQIRKIVDKGENQQTTENVPTKRIKTLPNDFIAMRLPKRQAKQNALKFYMDLEEAGERTSSDDEVSFPKKRKFIEDYSPENENLPFRKSRLRKTSKNSLKSLTHGRKLLRNKIKINKVVSVSDQSQGKSETIERVNTRSSSRSSIDTLPTTDLSKSKIVDTQELKVDKIRRQRHLSKIIKAQRKLRQHRVTRLSESSVTAPNDTSEEHVLLETPKPHRKFAAAGRVPKQVDMSQKTVKSEPIPQEKEISTSLTEIPTFCPTEEEFQEPIHYIQSISSRAEPYGMCKIIPPASWKMEGKISEETRFTTQKQYVHKMFRRFGPSVQKLECIRKHLEIHNPSEQMQIPMIGGVELDICKLADTIEEFGGMRNEIEKKKWTKVADAMNISKMAQDRGTKLYDAYCKFLLSYNDLSPDEKLKLESQVKADRLKIKREDQEEDCVVKGKNLALGYFIKTARNTASQHQKDESLSTEQTEKHFWEIVNQRKNHVVVHGGHIDTKTQSCSMFPTKKENVYSKHPWNLNNLPQHSLSLLKYLGPVPGVTVPTLHVGMLYTASCWSTDIHHLPYVQYLHGESNIVWYAVPSQEENKFKSAMKEVIPTLVNNSQRWLKEDTAMVPPEILLHKGVHLSRCVQQPHQFVVVFPRSYTATISCGYTLAESAHFATKEWIQQGMQTANMLQSCKEAELFSMEELICQIIEDTTCKTDLLKLAIAAFEQIIHKELSNRKLLHDCGIRQSKKMVTTCNTLKSTQSTSRRASVDIEESIAQCEVTKKICYLSMVLNEVEDLAFCLDQGVLHAQKKRNVKSCRLYIRHTEEELKKMLTDARARLKELTLESSQGIKRKARKLETSS